MTIETLAHQDGLPKYSLRAVSRCAVIGVVLFASSACSENDVPIDEQSIPELIETVRRNGSGNDRRNAMLRLQEHGAEAKAAVPVLLDALDEDQPLVRCVAAVALWKIDQHPRGISALLDVCEKEHPISAQTGVRFLAYIGTEHPAILPTALAALQKPDARMHIAAQDALLEMQLGVEDTPELIKVFRADDFSLGPYFVSVLLEQMGEPVIPLVAAGLNDPHPLVRGRCERLVTRIRDRGPLRRADSELSELPKPESVSDVRRQQGLIHFMEQTRKGVIKFHNDKRDGPVVGVVFLGRGCPDGELHNLKFFPQLQELVFIRDRVITNAALEHRFSELQEAGVFGKKLRGTDASLEPIGELKELRAMNLIGWRHITGDGLRHLAELKKLRSLQLACTQVDDSGLAHLTNLTGLQELDVFHTDVTDVGLTHVATLTELRYLDLGGEITDDGLKHLAGLENLHGLSLRGSKITDAGLPTLARLTTLEHLDLSDTKVTETGLESLRKALPNCKICNEIRK